jgi:aminopeptidase N
VDEIGSRPALRRSGCRRRAADPASIAPLVAAFAVSAAFTALASGARAGEAAGPPDVLTESGARSRAARVSRVSYDLWIRLAEGSESYEGRARLRFDLAGAPAPLEIDFRSKGVRKLRVNGRDAGGGAASGVRLSLPAAELVRGPNTVEVEYTNAFDRSGTGVHRFVDPVDRREYVFTDFEPYYAHRWFPCFDQPDLKATFRLTVEAPRGWHVVSNGPATAASERGTRVTHEFRQTPPLPTYLMFLAAGRFAQFVDRRARIPSRIFARATMARHVDVQDIFDVTRRGLAFYERYFSTPYPFAKYDQLFVPEFASGAMENPGAVTFNERYLFRHRPSRLDRHNRANVILHEMAHMWFGDLVTMRWWDDLWLNESFATYMACVALAAATPYREAFDVFLQKQKARAYWQDQLPTTHPVSAPVPNTDTAFSNFDGITYGKGAACLKQLAFLVGEKAFREGLSDYFRRHAWGNTEIRDFFAALARAHGRDLSAWSAAHVESAGVNDLAVRLGLKDGNVSACTVEQSPDGATARLRPHRVELVAYTRPKGAPGLTPVLRIPLSIEGSSTPVPGLIGAPAPAFVWPNAGDQAYARVFLDPGSVAFARHHLDELPDGLVRRGVWMTLWEMVRDAKLSPDDYLATFAAKAPLDGDATLVEGLFGNVKHALGRYVGDRMDEASGAIHDAARRRLERSSPGSDLQKAWFELSADTAVSPEALAWLEALLDGRIRPPAGISLDPEKRWQIVTRLSVRGRPRARERIEAERKRDPTDLGEKRALTAEAALPDPVVKEAVWTRVLEDRKTSIDQISAAMAGFHQPNQSALSRAFVARFFESIPRILSAGEQELNENYVESMFPAYVVDAAVLSRAQAYLKDNPGLSDDLRKPLVNAADELARTLRIRTRGEAAHGAP